MGRRGKTAVLTAAALLVVPLGILPAGSTPLAEVPSVGCPSDGQQGPIPPPKSGWKQLRLNLHAAKELAYYFGSFDTAILAPKGWKCLELAGSNGAMLFVTPVRVPADNFFQKQWKGVPGFGVMEMYSYGGTSGRFDVAKVVARVFPNHRNFVQSVIAEHLAVPSEFPEGPYPRDKLKRINSNVVEFETPPGTKGLGTEIWLKPNSHSIQGVAIVDTSEEEIDLLTVTVRLPPEAMFLKRDILSEVEQQRNKR